MTSAISASRGKRVSHDHGILPRRRLLIGAGGAVFAALAGCSKNEVAEPAASTSGAAAPAPESSRQAYEVASRGTGFVVGQAMAARSVLVFFDPQCPHCATLWVAAKPLHDRIRMVWMPVAFISPISAVIAEPARLAKSSPATTGPSSRTSESATRMPSASDEP